MSVAAILALVAKLAGAGISMWPYIQSILGIIRSPIEERRETLNAEEEKRVDEVLAAIGSEHEALVREALTELGRV